MKLVRILLFPIVPIYFLVTRLRNKLYDLDILKSKSYDFPIVAVGNLSTGGTGKTPMVEYLIRLIKKDRRVATLSRGYGRKTKGFLLGNAEVTAHSIGDEPFQFLNKFNADILVAVDEDRQHGISELVKTDFDPEVIILDDAFQHRKVKAGFYILLTTYDNLYVDDWVLPTGNLREPKSGAKRAQTIVVTKCPKTLTDKEKKQIISKLKPLPQQEVFFSSVEYSDILYAHADEKQIKELNSFVLVTGIANPNPLVAHLKQYNFDFEHLKFGDHHYFSENDIKLLESQSCIVTTEKDFMRLKHYDSLKDKLYYLPIRVNIDDKERFDNMLKRYTES